MRGVFVLLKKVDFLGWLRMISFVCEKRISTSENLCCNWKRHGSLNPHVELKTGPIYDYIIFIPKMRSGGSEKVGDLSEVTQQEM